VSGVRLEAGRQHMKQKLSNDQKQVLNFINKYHLAVVTTTDLQNPHPESALVAFVCNDKFEFFFQTNKFSRKAENIKKNSHVAFVLGLGLDDLGTIQYQGRVEQLTTKKDVEKCKKHFIDNGSPTAEPKYLDHPDAIYFKVIPHWIGYHDYSRGKGHVIELKHFT